MYKFVSESKFTYFKADIFFIDTMFWEMIIINLIFCNEGEGGMLALST